MHVCEIYATVSCDLFKVFQDNKQQLAYGMHSSRCNSVLTPHCSLQCIHIHILLCDASKKGQLSLRSLSRKDMGAVSNKSNSISISHLCTVAHMSLLQ